MELVGSTPEERVRELGLQIGGSPPPSAQYVRAKRSGQHLYLAGHGPAGPDGELVVLGRVGAELTPEEGRDAARMATISALGTIREHLGSLDAVAGIVKVLGFVQCAPGFSATGPVIDGCSELLVQVFGPAGVHARSAVGASILPRDMAVEIEMIVEVHDTP